MIKEILRLSELISFLVLSRNFLRLAFSLTSIFPAQQTHHTPLELQRVIVSWRKVSRSTVLSDDAERVLTKTVEQDLGFLLLDEDEFTQFVSLLLVL